MSYAFSGQHYRVFAEVEGEMGKLQRSRKGNFAEDMQVDFASVRLLGCVCFYVLEERCLVINLQSDPLTSKLIGEAILFWQAYYLEMMKFQISYWY